MTYPHHDRNDADLTDVELLEKHDQYAWFIATKWHRRYPNAELDDLYGEAVLGFLEAAKRYDRERGIRFSSYATCYAEKYIRLYVANVEARGVRFPEHRLIQAIGVMSINMSRTSGYSDNWVMHIPDRTPPDHGWTADEQWWCDALECIPSRRDREIVLRWAFGEKLCELAERFGLSKERARQIRNRGLVLIRRHNPRLLEDVA